MKDFGVEIREYLLNRTQHVYFPAPKSNSPDFFVLPPISLPKDEKLLIGVHAKCYSTNTVNAQFCFEEASKFLDNLQHIRDKSISVRGILIMLVTTGYTQTDFPSLKAGERAIMWKPSLPSNWPTEKTFDQFEVIIINISTSDLRKEFFGIALRGGTNQTEASKALEVLEALIRYNGPPKS